MNLTFIVYGQPAPSGSKAIGRNKQGQPFVRDASKRSYPWKQQVAQVAGSAMNGRELLTGPLMVHMHFYVPRPKGHYGKRGLLPSAPMFPIVAPDCLKYGRAVEDAMQGVVYRNDAQIVTEILIKSYGEPARCEVRFMPMYQPVALSAERKSHEVSESGCAVGCADPGDPHAREARRGAEGRAGSGR